MAFCVIYSIVQQRSPPGYSPWGLKESDITEQTFSYSFCLHKGIGIMCISIALKPIPGGSDGKESACNAGDPGLVPELGRSPWRMKRQPTPVFLPEKSHGPRSLAGYSLWVCKELNMTEQLTLSLKPLESFDEAGCVELQGVHPQAHCDSFCVCVCAGHALAAARYPNSLTSGGTLKWKCGVLTTGLPGKPHVVVLTQSLVCTSQWECLHGTFCMKSTCLV